MKIYKEANLEPSPLCIDKIRACQMLSICERSFDEHFRDIPRVKIGRSTRYLVSDLTAKLESLRVETESE